MRLRIPAASIAPDLRFAAAGALAHPGGAVPIGDMVLRADGRLSRSPAVPVYLRYADRDAVIVADGIDGAGELETCLATHIRATAEAGALDDLSLAVLALDAVDRCFRQTGLWPGNIYLAGTGTLAAVLHLAQDLELVHRRPGTVLRELAALGLTYLFPVAGKFRSGEYDGQVQYRLNGWGRALAARLTAGRAGAARVLRRIPQPRGHREDGRKPPHPECGPILPWPGAGWDRPEFEFLGLPFPSAAERSDRLEAVLRACRTAWREPNAGPSPIGPAANPGRPVLLVGGEGVRRTLPAAIAYADIVNWQVGVEEFARKSRVLADLCESVGRDPASLRRTHAPNFQLFDSERAFARWCQDEKRGMSSEEVYAYIRNRGALYGAVSAIEETIERFIDAGCGGFMVFCNAAPSMRGLKKLAALPFVQHAIRLDPAHESADCAMRGSR